MASCQDSLECSAITVIATIRKNAEKSKTKTRKHRAYHQESNMLGVAKVVWSTGDTSVRQHTTPKITAEAESTRGVARACVQQTHDEHNSAAASAAHDGIVKVEPCAPATLRVNGTVAVAKGKHKTMEKLPGY